jgi:UDP-3-O-[3-hydroxymyristoyl] N-acetylglucosamine deacetylase
LNVYSNFDNFINYLSEARTYAFFEDIEKMRTAGLAMGGNLNNALVVDKFKVLNPEGLRFEKEFVKHKTLDCVGDFYLLGMQLIGEVECFAPGHKLNQMFVKEILKDKNNYTIEKALISENPKNM